jgi:hypothetical protein
MIQPDSDSCPPTADGEHSILADPKLLADGWVRRHLADPDRAKEAIELYTSLGYEVKAQKLTPADLGPRCGDCSSVICSSYVLIYTRKLAANTQGPG